MLFKLICWLDKWLYLFLEHLDAQGMSWPSWSWVQERNPALHHGNPALLPPAQKNIEGCTTSPATHLQAEWRGTMDGGKPPWKLWVGDFSKIGLTSSKGHLRDCLSPAGVTLVELFALPGHIPGAWFVSVLLRAVWMGGGGNKLGYVTFRERGEWLNLAKISVSMNQT